MSCRLFLYDVFVVSADTAASVRYTHADKATASKKMANGVNLILTVVCCAVAAIDRCRPPVNKALDFRFYLW